MRLVDADEFMQETKMQITIASLCTSNKAKKEILQATYELFRDRIADAPTVEAVPVKHGKWEKAYVGADLEGGLCIGDTEYSGCLCSICRRFTYPYLNGQLEMKYCFNCGAKMDVVNK